MQQHTIKVSFEMTG